MQEKGSNKENDEKPMEGAETARIAKIIGATSEKPGQEVKKQAKENKEEKKQDSVPMYLIAMVLVLGVLVGVAGMMFFQPEAAPQDNGDDVTPVNDVAYRTVPVKMIYTDDCGACRQTNSFEELFIVREIPYEIEPIEASSPEGKKLVASFSLKTLPTALIDAQKVQFYPTTKSDFDSVLRKIQGYYVAPELNLNENAYYPLYLLEEEGQFCSGEKPSVLQFDDYYTPTSILRKGVFYDFTADFNETADFDYSFAQAFSRDENAIMANLFLTCAAKQGKYLELERQITGIYCNNPFKGDETILTGPEIDGCHTLSEHYGTPLSQFELDVALGRAGIDTNAFAECVEQRDFMMTNAENLVKDLEITRTGTFLLDCRENANAENAQ